MLISGCPRLESRCYADKLCIKHSLVLPGRQSFLDWPSRLKAYASSLDYQRNLVVRLPVWFLGSCKVPQWIRLLRLDETLIFQEGQVGHNRSDQLSP